MSKVVGITGFLLAVLPLISFVVFGESWFAHRGYEIGFALIMVWVFWGVFLSIKQTIEARKNVSFDVPNVTNMKFCKLLAVAGFSMTVISYFLTKANGPSSLGDVIFYAGWVAGAIGVMMCARKTMKAKKAV